MSLTDNGGRVPLAWACICSTSDITVLHCMMTGQLDQELLGVSLRSAASVGVEGACQAIIEYDKMVRVTHHIPSHLHI